MSFSLNVSNVLCDTLKSKTEIDKHSNRVEEVKDILKSGAL